MTIKLLIPYFGKFVSYFEFFLRSCAANHEIDFLIFTDQKINCFCPGNVIFHTLSFDAFKEMARRKLDLTARALSVLTPYKLCDYKPTYGVLFEDYIEGADFWGFCDVDLIFGRVFDLLSLENVRQSERVLTQGHLTLYKNCERMNHMFDLPLKGGISFRRAIEIREPCFFDEVFMPAICKREKVVQYGKNLFADILPQCGSFEIAPLCAVRNEKEQTFYWENGRLYHAYADERDELMYIHLQKRPLSYESIVSEYTGKIHITPQGFFTEKDYDISCEAPNGTQAQRYQKARWSALAPNKIWIKWRVNKFKERLK